MNVSRISIACVVATSFALIATPARAAEGGQQFADLGECKLENGQSITDCRIGYSTLGTLNAGKSNAVLVSIFPFAPSQYMASANGPWLSLLDPSKLFYVFVDPVGNGVSISPSNSKAQAGAAFPDFTIRDTVNINRRLLTEKLGIQHLAGVIGSPDMGSLQVYEWLLHQPDFADKVMMLQGTPRLSASDKLYWQALLKTVEDNIDKDKGTWKSPPFATAALWTLVEHNPKLINEVIAKGANNADALLKQFVDGFAAMNPHNVRAQFKTVLSQDATKDFKTLADAAKAAKAKTLFMISDSNEAFAPAPAMALASAMNSKPFVLSDGYGAGGLDMIGAPAVPAAIRDFLNK
jgi:homoserine O-acetyltransferase